MVRSRRWGDTHSKAPSIDLTSREHNLIKKALKIQAVPHEVLLKKLKVGTYFPLPISELFSWLRSLGLAQKLSNWLPTFDTQDHFLFR